MRGGLRGLAVGLLLAANGCAFAAVTVNLQYGRGDACVFTADTNGIGLGADGTIVTSGALGTGCGTNPGVTPTVGPIQASPMAPVVSTPFSLSFAAANAARCTAEGTILPAGSAVTGWPTAPGTLCSGTACNAFSASVSASAPGTYSFNATCYGTTGLRASSGPTSVAVSPSSTGSCAPAGLIRQTSGKIKTYPGGVTRQNVSYTDYDAVYGPDPGGGASKPWPGTTNFVVIPTLTRNQYMSLKFTVPTATPSTRAGQWTFTQTGTTSTTSMTVSTCEGDFTSSSLPTYCKADNAGEGVGIAWAMRPETFTCQLTPGRTYYLNYLNAPLAHPQNSVCTHAECSFATTNTITR